MSRISKVEKIIFVILILFVGFFIWLNHYFVSKIESENVVKQLIIDVGKEFKDIQYEIDRYEPGK